MMADTTQAFPPDAVSLKEKKDAKYILDYGKAIYARTKTEEFDTLQKRIIKSRKYAEGLQSIDKYKNLLGIKEGDISYLNLDWTVVPIIPKYVDLRVGEMINDPGKIRCTAIDITSKVEKQKELTKYLVNFDLKEKSKKIETLLAKPLIPKGEYIPEDEEEFKLVSDLTAVKRLKTELNKKVDEAEKAYGTIHVAFGNSSAIGGENDVPIHLDGVVLQQYPTPRLASS